MKNIMMAVLAVSAFSLAAQAKFQTLHIDGQTVNWVGAFPKRMVCDDVDGTRAKPSGGECTYSGVSCRLIFGEKENGDLDADMVTGIGDINCPASGGKCPDINACVIAPGTRNLQKIENRNEENARDSSEGLR